MTTLFDKVRYRKFLFPAWSQVRAAGSQSPSATTRTAIRRFRDDAPRNLERIQEDFRKGRFQFSPGTGIPIKRPGKDPRPIVVHDVRDRVVQRSLLNVVMSVAAVESEVKVGTSFGGVPGCGVDDAIRPIVARVQEGSGKYYIRSDIKNFFGTMPRGKALASLIDLLPDRSLNDFLEDATLTELSNHAELGHLLDFFPDRFTGVPQGHALSALLGNLLLREFDQAINGDGVIAVRYLDDFLILAPNKSAAWQAFRKGQEELSALGLISYRPGTSAKASEGSAQKLFEFLGCEIAPGFVRPSRSNRRKVLEEVRRHLRESNAAMTSGEFVGTKSYQYSVATTLRRVSLMLRGWSEQFSFCNYDQLRDQMDVEIDDCLREYLGIYASRRDRSTDSGRRRMAGVWLLTDAESKPIFQK